MKVTVRRWGQDRAARIRMSTMRVAQRPQVAEVLNVLQEGQNGTMVLLWQMKTMEGSQEPRATASFYRSGTRDSTSWNAHQLFLTRTAVITGGTTLCWSWRSSRGKDAVETWALEVSTAVAGDEAEQTQSSVTEEAKATSAASKQSTVDDGRGNGRRVSLCFTSAALHTWGKKQRLKQTGPRKQRRRKERRWSKAHSRSWRRTGDWPWLSI